MAKPQGKIQTTSILKNPRADLASLFYYVPLVGLSLGSRWLAVPATSLELKPDDNGGTIVDSGRTTMSLVESAFKMLKEAVSSTLPAVSRRSRGKTLGTHANSNEHN
jgi:hypothetical protein